jgi:hypothetical protein
VGKSIRLWLDDERDPSHWSPSSFFGIKWTWVKTAKEAVELLRTGKVFEISFDHDLGEEQDPIYFNGYSVAQFIEQEAFYGTLDRIKWDVHSANPVGRKNIEACMQQADKFWAEHERAKK